MHLLYCYYAFIDYCIVILTTKLPNCQTSRNQIRRLSTIVLSPTPRPPIHHCFISTTIGGGVAVIYKSTMKIVKVLIKHPGSVSVKLKSSDGVNMFCSSL